MNILKKLAVGAAFLGSMSMSFAGSGVSPWVNYWDSELSGSFGNNNATGKIVKKSDKSLGFGAKLHILGTKLNLSYIPLEYDSTITGAMTFKGQAYATGANLRFKWNTIDWSRGFFRIGSGSTATFRFLGGIQVVEAEARVSQTGIASKDFDETIPIPYIGITGDVRINDKLRFETTAKVLDLSIGDNDVEYADYEIGLRYFPKANAKNKGSLFVGYKSKNLDVLVDKGSATDEAKFDIEMEGMFVSYRFKF
jgi:hypothetical protein